MQKRVWQERALVILFLVILWVFGCFLGVFAESARAGDYIEDFVEHKHVRIAKEDPYYNAQFNPDSDIRLQAVFLLKQEEDEWLIIQKALYDSCFYVRGAAVAKLNSPQYNNLLWEIFWKDDSEYVRVNTMYNLVKNTDTAEKDSLQRHFMEIILNDEKWVFSAFGGLDKQKNQEFFVYLADKIIVENGGYMDGKFMTALAGVNAEKRTKWIEDMQTHFSNLTEDLNKENWARWSGFYRNIPE